MTPHQARRAYRELESAPPQWRIGERKPRYDAVLVLIWCVLGAVGLLVCVGLALTVHWLLGLM